MANIISKLLDASAANARAEQLQSELSALKADVEKAGVALAELNTKHAAEIAAITEAHELTKLELAAAKEEAQTAAQKAAEIVASQGVELAKLPAATAPHKQSVTLTRSEFNSLSPVDQTLHFRNGGKISSDN